MNESLKQDQDLIQYVLLSFIVSTFYTSFNTIYLSETDEKILIEIKKIIDE